MGRDHQWSITNDGILRDIVWRHFSLTIAYEIPDACMHAWIQINP